MEDPGQLLNEFIRNLSRPEVELMPLFWPGQHASSSAASPEKLRLVCQILFKEVERMGRIHNDLLKKTGKSSTLSGLDELFIGQGDKPLDAETLWGQVELQNESLHSILKNSLKKIARSIEVDGPETLCLLDMKEVLSEEDEEEIGVQSDTDNEVQGSDDDGDDDVVDEESRRIRQRMERSMADMEDSDADDDELDSDSDEKKRVNDETKDEADSPEDPAANELNDGFFDIIEMEDFADEEEAYLPEEAFGTAKPEDDADQPPKKSFHQKQREGLVQSDSDSDEDDDPFKNTETTVRRRKYREDDEVTALFSLYQNAQSDDDDDSVVNMTAADLFGKPNKKFFEKWQSRGTKDRNSKDNDEDADSWDEHGFENDGPGWRDDNSDDEEIDGGNEGPDDNDDKSEEDGERERSHHEDKVSVVASKSSHAKHAEKLRRQMEQLEKELLAEKPWQMTGESKSTSRPVNSLLEAAPEFEVATKMAPLITVEHTTNLEDVIKRRIISEDWDDVIPRELPDVGWNKKRGELPEVSQEKSKLGLGVLYEREYLKKAVGYDVDAAEKQTEEEKAQNEMKGLFASLCSKLDALSNYHFAPRPIADEADLRPLTTPAIAMEEVMPLHVSDARGVAPEEIFGSKKGREGVLRGESELDQAERKRLRGAKKAARRKSRKEKLADEKLISKLQPGLGLNNPYEKRKMREELSMARARGTIATGDKDANADYGASGKFFRRMQEEVEQSVRDDGGDGNKKRKRNNGSEGKKSSAFKL